MRKLHDHRQRYDKKIIRRGVQYYSTLRRGFDDIDKLIIVM